MRALAVDPASRTSRMVEAPVPEPRLGQVLVRIGVAGVNEMDVQIRAGGWAKQAKAFGRAGPVLTGFEFAGVAASDGRRIRKGQRVVGYSPVLDGPRVHAEYAVVPETPSPPCPTRSATRRPRRWLSWASPRSRCWSASAPSAAGSGRW